MAVKRTRADKWFSDCIRIRSNWICDHCGINLQNDRGKLHCSHYISRGKLSTRYHPLNAMAHCYSCHEKLGGGRWGGGDVAEFTYHYDEMYGADVRDKLRRLSKMPFRKHNYHIDMISDFYRNEFKRMDQKRKNGVTDRLEFPFYDKCLELNAIVKSVGG